MSGTHDDLVLLGELVAELVGLDGEFWRKRAEYRRGSLPAGGGGRRGSSDGSPMLRFDRVDARAVADGAAYVAAVRQAKLALSGALRLVTATVVPVPGLPEPVEVPCQRLSCDRVVSNVGSDRLRPSRVDGLRVCPACEQAERRARRAVGA